MPVAEVEHGRKALAGASWNFYGRDRMSGSTSPASPGTNGKTTTAYLADAMLARNGRTHRCADGAYGDDRTIEYRIGEEISTAQHYS